MVPRGAPFNLIVLLAGMAPACLLYTDPINSAPEIEILAPAEVFPGASARFTARTRDADGDRVTVRWRRERECPVDPSRQSPSPGGDEGDEWETPVDTHEAFCVLAQATDSRGARGLATHLVEVGNRVPEAQVELVRPARGATYRMFTGFRLSGAMSTDADGDGPLLFSWSLGTPPGSASSLLPCDDAGNAEEIRCFTALAPGIHTVALQVGDGFVLGPPAAIDLTVDADAPPCIRESDPPLAAGRIVLSRATERTLEVRRVDDDGDPFPRGEHGVARFSWSRSLATGVWERRADYDFPSLVVPRDSFQAGDTVRFRVEALDREAEKPERSLASCGDAPICELRPGCPQRITFTLEYR